MTDPDLSAYRGQHAAIQEEFKKQAPQWQQHENSPHLRWVIEHLDLQPHFEVLDVAAGTGILSRALATHVQRVVALDLTPEMLAQGQREADHSSLNNIRFEQGAAEKLPYPAESFDMVATRFSIHHFQSPNAVLQEMARVCRPNGQLVVIDLVSPEDLKLATRYNNLERLRDSSHTWALSASGLRRAVAGLGLEIVAEYVREVEMHAANWLDFTRTEPGPRQSILNAWHGELQGLGQTGFQPFLREGQLMFQHHWGIVVGKKAEA